MQRCSLLILLVIIFNALAHVAYAQDTFDATVKPEWAKTLRPTQIPGKRCYIGSVTSASSREKSLDEAYKNALIEVVRKEFPELIRISEKSSETLKGSTYSRDTVFQSDKVQFFGLTEEPDSPFIEPSKMEGYDAYRFVCWPIGAVDVERKRQADAAKTLSVLPSNRFEDTLPEGATGPMGRLEIVTIPSGASIDFASSPIGRSNASFEKVAAGQYEIVIQKTGYEIKSESVQISAGKTTKLFVELQKINSTIKIVSEPPGARIYVDNKPYVIPITPAEISDEVGKNIEVRLEMDDYRVERRNLEITYKPRVEKFQMALLPGAVSIRSTPEGAMVFVNDEKQSIATPAYLKLPGGHHSLRVTLPGFDNYSEELDVRASKPRTIIARLLPSELEQEKFSPEFKNKAKYIAGGGFILSGILFALSQIDKNKADTSYKSYKSAVDKNAAISARKDVENYNQSSKQKMLWSEILAGLSAITIVITW